MLRLLPLAPGFFATYKPLLPFVSAVWPTHAKATATNLGRDQTLSLRICDGSSANAVLVCNVCRRRHRHSLALLQNNFNNTSTTLQQHIQDVHTFAEAKHHSHLEEALERRRLLEEYRALAQEKHASDLRTNRDRVLRHQNPLTITVDLSLTRPLRTALSPPLRPPTANLQQVGPL